MSRGATLLEIILALVVMGLLGTIVLPSARDLHDRLLVDEAARTIAVAHVRARLAATTESQPAVLTIDADSLRIALLWGADTLVRWTAPGPQTGGVTLTGGGRRVLFAPSGISFGLANATYTLTRGARVKQVVVSRYGRVRVQ
jgi:Tfp pilus assembly protein FimT